MNKFFIGYKNGYINGYKTINKNIRLYIYQLLILYKKAHRSELFLDLFV